jgi:hypothetical protein
MGQRVGDFPVGDTGGTRSADVSSPTEGGARDLQSATRAVLAVREIT